ncbi:hypothetical protein HYALB_00003116 [Hymenoscyphus albidus]|uniref:Uncharacterized protein n=1 Tax=Hymenoscyphus albidus TaxID=595503 RepID=A0A9N9LCL8_9HELO|nr:hypothetical protein HYALB_00003116 [Hymenoscyphus albidus]
MSNQQDMVNQYCVQHSHGTHTHTHSGLPRARRGSHLARLETSTLSPLEQVDANSPSTEMPRSQDGDGEGSGGAVGGHAGGRRAGVSGSLMSEASSEGDGRYTPQLSDSMISELSLGSTGQRTLLSGSMMSEASSEKNGRHTPQMSDSMISSASSEWSTQYTPPATSTNSLILDKASTTDTSKATSTSTTSNQQVLKRSSRKGNEKPAHKTTPPRKNPENSINSNLEAPPNIPRTLSSTISNLWQWVLSQTTTPPQLSNEHDALLRNLSRLDSEEQKLDQIEDGLERAIIKRRIKDDRPKAENKLEKLAREAFEREERDGAAEGMRRVVVREQRGNGVAEKVVGAGIVVMCSGLAWRERGRWMRGEGLVVRGAAWSWRAAGETPWTVKLWQFVILSQWERN